MTSTARVRRSAERRSRDRRPRDRRSSERRSRERRSGERGASVPEGPRSPEEQDEPDGLAAPGPSRRRYLARRWVALLIVLVVLGLAYVVVFTPVLGVRTVAVTGTRDLSADTVRAKAAIELGTPMVRLDTDAAARRVATLPRVFEVSVTRSFPSTVEIKVTERDPVAVRLVSDGAHLVDRTGVDYATVRARPRGLPLLSVARVAPNDARTHAAVTVLGAIPDQLRARIVEITARTPGDVRLKLTRGKVVKWGDEEDNARKAAVLAPLLTRPGRVYDVATPDFPTVAP